MNEAAGLFSGTNRSQYEDNWNFGVGGGMNSQAATDKTSGPIHGSESNTGTGAGGPQTLSTNVGPEQARENTRPTAAKQDLTESAFESFDASVGF
ncbi:hypothetical protein CVT25_015098 [Psilocybe cyanescens]|uniref:Uncharacterized protein n=1 Tax=Psilocybe cyanescens TaxID=93625 RepID=A0A409WS61_PSICY|nr:hypothetical protein CVT25_015098 [Psilocybe cyanescens]